VKAALDDALNLTRIRHLIQWETINHDHIDHGGRNGMVGGQLSVVTGRAVEVEAAAKRQPSEAESSGLQMVGHVVATFCGQ
jgi:hypothetical protein